MLSHAAKIHFQNQSLILSLFLNHGPVIMNQEIDKELNLLEETFDNYLVIFLRDMPENRLIKLLSSLSTETKDKIMNVLRPDI